jgi:hypothetical protein
MLLPLHFIVKSILASPSSRRRIFVPAQGQEPRTLRRPPMQKILRFGLLAAIPLKILARQLAVLSSDRMN